MTELIDTDPIETRVVAIANQKGGVGKTTTTVNLAACLAQRGWQVLLIDLDPQANATSGLGLPMQEGASLYRALLGHGSTIGLLQPTMVPGLDIIPSELDLAGSEVDVARQNNYLHCLNRALKPLIQAGRYHLVLLDCPPALGILTMNALTASHGIMIPMQCEYYALEGLSVMTRIVGQLRDSGANPRLEIEGILMTMFDGRTRLSGEVVAEVRKHFGETVYETTIPRNVRLSEAPSYGQSIIDYDKHSRGAKAYQAFADEFVARSGNHVPGGAATTPVPEENAPTGLAPVEREIEDENAIA
jgi:chromosome partitioning protein